MTDKTPPLPKGRFIRFDRRNGLRRKRRWYFRYEGANHEPVFQSEAYNSKAARENGIEAARSCWGAPVIEGEPK